MVNGFGFYRALESVSIA